MSATPAAAGQRIRAQRDSAAFRPFNMALKFAVGYCVVSMIYIYVSGHIAAELAESVFQLETIEKVKGYLFVLTTSGMLFVLGYRLFRRIAMREAELKVQREALIASERRAAASLFASSIAHDINNILMISDFAITDLTQSTDKSSPTAELVEQLAHVNSQLKELATRLSDVGRQNLPHEFRTLDLPALVRDVISLARTHRKLTYCTVDLQGPETLLLTGIPLALHQLFLNLLLNAGDATGGRGRILVRIRPEQKQVILEVHDNGPGVPESEEERIFEPFYTTKGQGSGLGLMSVKVCAEAHDGSVRVRRSELGGACFEVTIPARTP